MTEETEKIEKRSKGDFTVEWEDDYENEEDELEFARQNIALINAAIRKEDIVAMAIDARLDDNFPMCKTPFPHDRPSDVDLKSWISWFYKTYK